jgi:hypothetical protein
MVIFLLILIPLLIPRPVENEGQEFATLIFAHFDTAFDSQIGVRERERIYNAVFFPF